MKNTRYLHCYGAESIASCRSRSGVHLISSTKWNLPFLSSYPRNGSLQICQVGRSQRGQNTIVASPPPLLWQHSQPNVTSPIVMKASSSVRLNYVSVKQWLSVEEQSKFWKHLVASCGMFWSVGMLCRSYQNCKYWAAGSEKTVDCQVLHVCVDTAGVSGY